MYFSPTLPKAKHDLFQTLLPALFLFLLLCSFIFQSLIWQATVTAWMKNLSGKDAVVNLFSNSTVFAFPRCDCAWNFTLDRSTWLPFNFVFFLYWIGAAQRPSFINQFVVVAVQWQAACCRIHLRPVMVRYGLAKVLRGVKALQTHMKSANGFWKLTHARTSKPFWKF